MGLGEDASLSDAMLEGDFVLRAYGLDDYKMIENLSTKQQIVLSKGNKVKIVFRGKNDATDMPHVYDTIKGKSRDYSHLDKLLETVRQQNPGKEVEIVSYSNGAPKGLYLSEKYKLTHDTIDPLLGPKETDLLLNKTLSSAKLNILKTTRTGVSSPAITATQILGGKTPNNTTITEVQPVRTIGNPMQKFVKAHKLHNFSLKDEALNTLSDTDLVKAGLRSKNMGGSLAAGIIPGALTSLAVEGIAPDANPEIKKVGVAAGSALGTQLISPVLGAGAAPMTSTILPIYAGIQAADLTDRGLDAALPNDMNVVGKSTLKGGVDAAVGLGAGAGTMAATTAIRSGVASMLAPTAAAPVAVTEGVELGAIGGSALLAEEASVGAVALAEGVEMTALGAGAAVAAEEVGVGAAVAAGAAAGGLGLSELGPLALGGVAIGAGIGLVSGLIAQSHQHHHKQKKTYALMPGYHEDFDTKIGSDSTIIRLVNSIPENASEEQLESAKRDIQARVNDMGFRNYQYSVKLKQVPDLRDVANYEYDPSETTYHPNHQVMLDGDYSSTHAYWAQEWRRDLNAQSDMEVFNHIVEQRASGYTIGDPSELSKQNMRESVQKIVLRANDSTLPPDIQARYDQLAGEEDRRITEAVEQSHMEENTQQRSS